MGILFWSIGSSTQKALKYVRQRSIANLDVDLVYVYMYIYIYMYGHHIYQSMDQPGKVANPARGQLNRENKSLLVPVRA